MMLLAIIFIFSYQAVGYAVNVNILPPAAKRIIKPEGVGEISLIQMYPYLASVQINGSHLCGGSILSQQVILTAAHCVIEYQKSNLSVQVGSTNLKYGGSRYGGSNHTVVAMEIHEKYNDSGLHIFNDVALLKVSPSLEFRLKVNNVLLSSSGQVFSPGTAGIVAGWGQMTKTGQTITSGLRDTNLFIVDNEKCAENYGYESGRWISSNGFICAAAPNSTICLGDSGGPLVVDHMQIGIMSRSSSCATPKLPRLYTSVAFHGEWIEKHFKILDPSKKGSDGEESGERLKLFLESLGRIQPIM